MFIRIGHGLGKTGEEGGEEGGFEGAMPAWPEEREEVAGEYLRGA
jgi:hypothetical protein